LQISSAVSVRHGDLQDDRAGTHHGGEHAGRLLALRERQEMSSSTDELVLHPTVTKTFFKGLIAIGVFSLFLEVNPANLGNYFIFLAISIALVFCYMGAKWSARYVVGSGGVTIHALLRAEKNIAFSEIEGITISQGILAKRFRCGSLYLQLSARRKGSYISLTGATAETLRDVKNPNEVYQRIASAMNPMFGA
jgi:Bacterial PH domain